MRRIREFESRTAVLYRDGEVPGFVHLSVGQEAAAVGVCSQLRADDIITSTHRGHGHVMAKGLDMTAMFAELMGRATGVCGGFGGSMHIADPALGIYGANGIVGAGLPIAVGAAFAARVRGGGQVVAAFFGDGAVATGAFHESVNLAALWRLPVLFVCENNGFSEFSRTVDQHPVPLRQRAVGYGITHETVDGNDVEMTARATAGLVARLRGGDGPFLLEAVTNRVRGHYEGDPQRYRAAAPGANGEPPAADPLERARVSLAARGIATESIDAAVSEEVDRAVRAARAAPWPDPARMAELGDVRRIVAASREYAAPAAAASLPTASPDPGPPAAPIRGSHAVRAALDDALTDDPRVFLAGIDVAAGGNVFGVTKGLAAPGDPHPVRRRPLLRQPAFAEPGGTARSGARLGGRDAGHRRGHVRPAPFGDRPAGPGRRHREPAALRAQGRCPGTRMAHPDRAGERGPPGDGHHDCHGLPGAVHRA
jgi:2-oxoisovalerate dehydrogenase E1 component